MSNARNVERIGNWLLWFDPLPGDYRGEDWAFMHVDYQGERHGDPRIGRDESRKMCIQTMDYLDSEEAFAQTPEGKAKEEAAAKRVSGIINRELLIHDLGRAVIAANSVLASGGRGFADGVLLQQIKRGVESYKEYAP